MEIDREKLDELRTTLQERFTLPLEGEIFLLEGERLEHLYRVLLDHLVYEHVDVPAQELVGAPVLAEALRLADDLSSYVRVEAYESEWEAYLAAAEALALMSRLVRVNRRHVLLDGGRYFDDPEITWREWGLLSYLLSLDESISVDTLYQLGQGEQREVLGSVQRLLETQYVELDPEPANKREEKAHLERLKEAVASLAVMHREMDGPGQRREG